MPQLVQVGDFCPSTDFPAYGKPPPARPTNRETYGLLRLAQVMRLAPWWSRQVRSQDERAVVV